MVIYGFLYAESAFAARAKAEEVYHRPSKRHPYAHVERLALRYCEKNWCIQNIYAVTENDTQYRGLYRVQHVARVGYDALDRPYVDLTPFGASLRETHEA